MRLFGKLSKQLRTYLTEQQVDEIKSAFIFAEHAHKVQTRNSGEPYITHPVAVASILATMRMDPQTIMAALLHDVIEDTHIEKNSIAAQFGNTVADLVEGSSKLERLKFTNQVDAQAENFRKMLLAVVKDIRVILIKLADRLHNISTISALPWTKQRRIVNETLEIYIPLADRLGMRALCIQLQNLCFQTLYPKRYATLNQAIKNMYGRRKGAIQVIQQALYSTLITHNFKYLAVIGREKNLYSVYQKMRIKRASLTDIMDMYAFRIIVETVDECYRALGFVHMLYKPISEHFKDYIAIPKTNGYQSLHTTLFGLYGVPIEIQIRTREMNSTAECGIASHWNYKQGYASNYLLSESTQAWLQSLLAFHQKAGNSLEFIENVKSDLFPSEIYVFTPKGKIIELPMNATIVDFAYAVHSDIGNCCIGGKIDRQFAPLSTKLSSGQMVEIVTSTQENPSALWLNFVVTGKARSNIRHFVNKLQHSELVKLGESLLNSLLHSLGTKTTPISIKESNLQRVLVSNKFKQIEELYYSIGAGNHNLWLIAQRLITDPDQAALALVVAQPVSIKGSESFLLQFAKCCLPIPDDLIVGCLEAGQGITVHASVCQHIVGASDQPEKYFPLRWDEQVDGNFAADLRIIMHNRRGTLAKILQQLVTADVDIDDFKLLTKEADHVKLKIIIAVKNRQHLANVLRKLRVNQEIMVIKRHVNASNRRYLHQTK